MYFIVKMKLFIISSTDLVLKEIDKQPTTATLPASTTFLFT